MLGLGVSVAVASSCPSGENATPNVRPQGFITPGAVEIGAQPGGAAPPSVPEIEGPPPAPDPDAPPWTVEP
jgi:hypothetical protein